MYLTPSAASETKLLRAPTSMPVRLGFARVPRVMAAVSTAEMANVAELNPNAAIVPMTATTAPPAALATDWKSDVATWTKPLASATSSKLRILGITALCAGLKIVEKVPKMNETMSTRGRLNPAKYR